MAASVKISNMKSGNFKKCLVDVCNGLKGQDLCTFGWNSKHLFIANERKPCKLCAFYAVDSGSQVGSSTNSGAVMFFVTFDGIKKIIQAIERHEDLEFISLQNPQNSLAISYRRGAAFGHSGIIIPALARPVDQSLFDGIDRQDTYICQLPADDMLRALNGFAIISNGEEAAWLHVCKTTFTLVSDGVGPIKMGLLYGYQANAPDEFPGYGFHIKEAVPSLRRCLESFEKGHCTVFRMNNMKQSLLVTIGGGGDEENIKTIVTAKWLLNSNNFLA